ncbi:hypothetical protein Acr_00g0054820 [Actinidia rufa]|uniref:Uncharacterized protein n=1 Tax=Actinidia rufa TaxID=165716 RepID=A0A7J0DN89_9ERIC|nr:hypothetical protein Acr_00g0054820 [Actinidia rufa]
MPNKDNTANVGDLMEMESQGHLILRVTSKMDKIGIGDVRTHGEHSRKFELNEVITSAGDLGDLLTSAGDLGEVLISAGNVLVSSMDSCLRKSFAMP